MHARRELAARNVALHGARASAGSNYRQAAPQVRGQRRTRGSVGGSGRRAGVETADAGGQDTELRLITCGAAHAAAQVTNCAQAGRWRTS